VRCCRTPAPVVPTTPASLSRYCLVDVDSFPSPFSGELFGGGSGFVSLDPLPPPSTAASVTALTPYQLGGAAAVTGGHQQDSRLLTLAATGLSPGATMTATQMTATASVSGDNEVSSSCISGVLISDQQTPHHDQPDIAR